MLIFIVFATLIHSCIHDDVYSASDPSNTEYHSKSPWKEDEVYIKNVKAVFNEYADKDYFITNFGTVYWDYAVTMGTEETFLEVPVVKNDKVNFILLVYRDGDRIFFKRKEGENSKEFFKALVFNDRKSLISSKLNNSANSESKGGCVTIETTWTWTNDDGSAGPTYTSTEMHCLPSGPYLPCQAVDVNANCGGSTGGSGGSGGSGGGGGGGTGYPYPNQTQDACAKIKQNQTKPKYYQKYNELNTNEVLNMDKERGFYELQPPKGVNAEGGFVQIDGAPGTTGLDLPANPERISGLFHTHNNIDGSIKIFSPTDVRTFINIFLKNAREYAGSYSNAYSTVVTSAGSYTLKFTKDTHPGGINYATSKAWGTWYEAKMYEIKQEDGTFDQNKVEQIFTQFLNEVVNIDGLEVYKVTAISSAKLTYNPTTKQVNATPCPQ